MIPTIFISSTCNDLLSIRDDVEEFILNYGFLSTRSDRGDVPFTPDLHTHEACVKEAGLSNALVLIIGGRHGGPYVNDPRFSVTRAEYEKAYTSGVPIFCFIHREVWDAHYSYVQEGNLHTIEGLGIFDKIEYAGEIFNFIDRVRKRDKNNGLYFFKSSEDITGCLKKQWAGMFFHQLSAYKEKNALKKLEPLAEVDIKNPLDFFFNEVFIREIRPQIKKMSIAKRLHSLSPKQYSYWYEYLIGLGIYERIDFEGSHNYEMDAIFIRPISGIKGSFTGYVISKKYKHIALQAAFFDGVLDSDKKAREKIIQKVLNS